MKRLDVGKLQDHLGYKFKDVGQLERALCHTSTVASPKMQVEQTYQRHEFLGDRVLAVVVADMLLKAFPKADEGELARRFNGLVRNETCADVAREIGVGPFIRLGEGEAQAGGRKKEAILGDVCEAIIGAVYIDGGLDEASKIVTRYWEKRMLDWSGPLRDPKTTLQEWVQGNKLPPPVYSLMERTGPDHAPEFTLKVKVPSLEPAVGKGSSKRIAEQEAARSMLIREGQWNDDQA
ncbi:RNAse III [Cohaesibacter sp. ES.047]|uniref:ribonuclease III n=1 Tax=Cohaesibacter sp. ES.047 TaxID=1798205 RepID=UPI000BB74EAE|nr:ribonuclease III [Cohaesibacter sp. ES.047]SNY93067.1 RNAse III [Cohaesibacter sp. ES.047]